MIATQYFLQTCLNFKRALHHSSRELYFRLMHQFFEAMWWQNNKPNFFFRSLSRLYAVLSAYDLNQRQKRQQKSSIPLISIGNITVGGSGKTPFVLWLAQILQEQGYQPVLLCRGDGGKKHHTPQWVSQASLSNDVGDEAVLLARLSGCPVLAGKNRVLAASMAAEKGNIILLDDGFQYRQLHRLCDIVLVPDEGVGNGYLLPAGPLREPVHTLSRADIIVRSGAQHSTPLSPQYEWQWSAQSKHIKDWNQQSSRMLSPTQHIHAVSSIARPKRFLNDLIALGFTIDKHHHFPDHYAYQAQDIKHLSTSHHPIVTTAKDAVKLLPLWPKHKNLWVLEQQASAEHGLAQAILKLIQHAATPQHDKPF